MGRATGNTTAPLDEVVIAKGESVRFALRNPTGMDHPFHMHGHTFRVLGKPGAVNLTDPPLKDTVNVPAGGSSIATSSGTWPRAWPASWRSSRSSDRPTRGHVA